MDPKTELAIETLTLQVEILAATLLVSDRMTREFMERTGHDPETFELGTEDKEQHTRLLQSAANRLINVAILSAQESGVNVDKEQVAKNVVSQFLEAAETGGKNFRDEGIDAAIFDGAYVSDDSPNEELKETIDVETSDGSPDEGLEETPSAAISDDDDLFTLFKTARSMKSQDPHLEIEGGVVRANFYQPETLPETPEEFMDYDNKATAYFLGLTDKVERAKIMDEATANQVRALLSGGTVQDQEVIMLASETITQTIIEQGQDSTYFEVSVDTPNEAAGALVAAYSVSIARLRGMYMQAKFQELQEYAEQSS